MKILQKTGVCEERYYNYGKIEKASEINEDAVKNAQLYRIKKYAKVLTQDGLKKSLVKNGPCIISFPVYNHSDVIWEKRENDEYKGGHAMTVVGYTEDSYIIRNSWGERWGDDGYCYYKFKDWGRHWEVWTAIDDDTNTPPVSPRPPPIINKLCIKRFFRCTA